MSVYRHRNSPYWQFDFQRGGYRFSGSTAVPVGRPKAEARAAEAQEIEAAERLVREIRDAGRKPLTLGAACDRWWDEVGQHLAEHKTVSTALAFLKAQIGADRPLHALTDDDVLRAIAARRRHVKPAGRDDKGTQLYREISARTVNNTVPILLRRVVRRARDLWDAVVIREPKWGQLLLDETRRRTPEITIEQEEAIDAAERSDYRDIRHFATITGLRLREALLRWADVDFEAGVVHIVAKGGVPRTVPLSRTAYAILWRQRGRHDEWVFTFVAARTKVDPRTRREYIRGQRYPITAAGLTSNRKRHWPVKARWHDLRHTAARRTLRTTGNLKIVQRMLGHSDIKTTADVYADVLIDDVRAAMNATETAVESRKKALNRADKSSKSLSTRGKRK
ncbi:MAG: site-specific integrase [Rhodovulum sp.]|nr:site-specific integrase [Rhodovulum sp.]